MYLLFVHFFLPLPLPLPLVAGAADEAREVAAEVALLPRPDLTALSVLFYIRG